MNAKEKHGLKKIINELSLIRGRHTELVSVYIPQEYDINKVIQHLQQEQGTAQNIKSASTRTNVIDALERMIRSLRLYKQTPPNGLAIFSGNTSEREGKVDLNVWAIEPPKPIKTRLYRCDQTFVLDPLKEQLEYTDFYALIVLDKKEATIGLLKGTSIITIKYFHSSVPGKFKTGGQSANRFRNIRENLTKEFFIRVADAANTEFLPIKTNIKGVLIGGPGMTKNEFIDSNCLNDELQRKIVAVKDLTYTDESGLHHLVESCQDVLAKEDIIREKQLMNRFFETFAKDENKIAYGIAQVKEMLEMGVVDTLLLSDSIEDKTAEELETIAEKYSTKTEYISTETKEGMQLKELGKVGAILRYPIVRQ